MMMMMMMMLVVGGGVAGSGSRPLIGGSRRVARLRRGVTHQMGLELTQRTEAEYSDLLLSSY